MTRRALLARHGIHLPTRYLPDQLSDASLDNVLAAAAAAWSAHRLTTGHAG
jgi:hypothetical protein